MKWEVLFETFQTFQPITGVSYLKLSDKTWNEMCYLKVFNLFKPIMRAAYLKLSGETWKRGAIWNFWNLKLFIPIMRGGVAYLKLSDEIWNEMCYLKLLTFSNPSWELLIWNFQMRLETRYAIWNFWNLKLFKHVMGVAYFKLSDETWKRGAIWNVWNLKLFKHVMGGSLFETFRWDLKWDVLFETFLPFQTHHKSCLF